jgi:flagella basal body P-ring formation protein FlgA
MMKSISKILTLLVSTCLASYLALGTQALAAAPTNTYQSLDEIHQLVTDHIKQKIDQQTIEPTIELRKLSPTLKLPKCQQPLELKDRNPNKGLGRMTISVNCLQPKWRVFVPAVVDGKQPVVIASQGIIKHAVIKETDVEIALIPYKKVPSGSMIHLETTIGMKAKQSIGANDILRIKDLELPYWVFKKQPVTLITRIGSIQVRTKGIALEDGVEQARVPVKNLSSGRIIKGIVIAPNTVLVP